MSLHYSGSESVSGYVRAEGPWLVNGEGQKVLLRGVGFGGWLLPEGYMWRFPEQGDRPRRMEQFIENVIGEEEADQFWQHYFERFISEADIKRIAAEGFNSVRVPFLARRLIQSEQPLRWNEEHLALLDRVIGWCRQYRLYVVLDMHGAPGGQTGTNIDDSERDYPELFADPKNQELAVSIWRMLAERYRDEWIVAGYDLLNEPLPEWFSKYNDRVMPFYEACIQAIREVDPHHMIILEGVHWSTDWSIFTQEMPDENILLQFHKYWNNPDTESIQQYLDMRDAWNVPIYMGEGGENNCNWYTGAFSMFDDHCISWNFWTWKKMDTSNSPCSIQRPEGWGRLVDALEGRMTLKREEAKRILWEFLDHLPFEKCTYHESIVNAMMRRVPVRIPAAFYGYEGEKQSFSTEKRTEHHIGFRQSDGVKMGFVTGNRDKVNFHHGGGEEWSLDERTYVELDAGDWLAYKVLMPETKAGQGVVIDLRMSPGHRQVEDEVISHAVVKIDDQIIGEIDVSQVPLDNWQTITVTESMELTLSAGEHRIVISATEGSVRFEWLELRYL